MLGYEIVGGSQLRVVSETVVEIRPTLQLWLWVLFHSLLCGLAIVAVCLDLLDAERCGRSFEAQVLALLRRHYGADVDIAPSADDILSLATSSLAGIPPLEARRLVDKLKEPKA